MVKNLNKKIENLNYNSLIAYHDITLFNNIFESKSIRDTEAKYLSFLAFTLLKEDSDSNQLKGERLISSIQSVLENYARTNEKTNVYINKNFLNCIIKEQLNFEQIRYIKSFAESIQYYDVKSENFFKSNFVNEVQPRSYFKDLFEDKIKDLNQ